MKIILAGGSGFLGRPLAARLADDKHEVVVLTRDTGRSTAIAATGVRSVAWDPDGSIAEWAYEVDGADAVVNLAGAGIADRRWTADRKALLRSSRVESTRSLVTAVRIAKRKPAVFVQASAIGFYGTASGARELDESFPPGDDFLARLVVAWEAEAHPAAAMGCRLVFTRSGVILARDGGALKKMLPPFRLFVGGPIASGRQYLSWIHRDDWIGMVTWAIAAPAVTGALNVTAPTPVTNADFSKALGRALRRPSWLPVPAFALRILFGELAEAALINGQRVLPKHALDLGFAFKRPSLDEALHAELAAPKSG